MALLAVVALAVSGWMILLGVVAAARVIEGVQRRRLSALRQRLREAASRAPGGGVIRADDVDRLLGHLGRSTIDRLVIRLQSEPPLAEACMAHALRRWPTPEFVASCRARRATVWRRVAALFILAHARHPELFVLLRDALHDARGDVTEAALRVLGRLRDRRAGAILVDLLCKGPLPASRVAAVIDSSPLEIPELLLPLTTHRRPELRFWAATLLGRYAGETGVAGAISRLGQDHDPRVRKAAVDALAKARRPEAIVLAQRLATDAVFFVRAHAIRALGTFGQAQLAQPLAGALEDANWWVRLAAKETLWATVEPDVVAER